MTTLAMILQDRKHVLIKSRRCGDSRPLKRSPTKADGQLGNNKRTDSPVTHAEILQARRFPSCTFVSLVVIAFRRPERAFA